MSSGNSLRFAAVFLRGGLSIGQGGRIGAKCLFDDRELSRSCLGLGCQLFDGGVKSGELLFDRANRV